MSEYREQHHQESASQVEHDPRAADHLLHDTVRNTEIRISELPTEKKRDIEQAFMESGEINNYLAQETNIRNIEGVVDWLPNECANHKLGPRVTKKVLETVSYLLGETKSSSRHYAQSVARFEHILSHKINYDQEEAEKLARADRDRRITHDAALDAFRAFNGYVSIKLNDDYGINVPNTMQFSDSRIFLDRQGYGTEWIQTTDLYLQSRGIVEKIKKEEVERETQTS